MIIDIVTLYLEGKGGLENVISTVVKGLTARGHRVRVFLNSPPRYKEWLSTLHEVYYYETKFGDPLLGLYVEYSLCLAKLEMPDVIIATHSPSQGFICRNALGSLPYKEPPIISWCHLEPEFFGNIWAFNNCDGHFAISSGIAKTIKEYVWDKSEVTLLYNPIPWVNDEDIKQCKDSLKLVFIGRIVNKHKRLDVLLQALKDLKFSWSLDIFGSGPDESSLKLTADILGISKNITWHGWVDHPFQEIEEATALVLPSDFEGFGLVLAEALMRGIPVISSDTTAVKDIITEGVNGWIFKKQDVDALKQIFLNLHDSNYDLPSPTICKESVEKFEENRVIDHMEQELQWYVDHKKAYYEFMKREQEEKKKES